MATNVSMQACSVVMQRFKYTGRLDETTLPIAIKMPSEQFMTLKVVIRIVITQITALYNTFAQHQYKPLLSKIILLANKFSLGILR